MKDKKDNFSAQSDHYSKFRPQYPAALYEWIYSHFSSFDAAWDCATGNGQAAIALLAKFKVVQATDISTSQLAKGYKADNIQYSQQPAEQTSFPDNSFDLITVAQALHWLDHDLFFQEVKRAAKPGCLFAAWGYNLVRVNEQVDNTIDHFYTDVVGAYWDDERRHVETEYSNIDVPFESIVTPEFYIQDEWSAAHMLGYLNSWSAVQHYIKANGNNPVVRISEALKNAWGDNVVTVRFPVFVRAALIKK